MRFDDKFTGYLQSLHMRSEGTIVSTQSMRRSTYKSYDDHTEPKPVKQKKTIANQIRDFRWSDLSMLEQISVWIAGFFFAYSLLVFIIGYNFSSLFGTQVSKVIGV